MKYTNELKNILDTLEKESTPGNPPMAVDVIIKIMEKYTTQPLIEDPVMVCLLKQNFIEKPKLTGLVDDLISYKTSIQKSKEGELKRVLEKVEEISGMYPNKTSSIFSKKLENLVTCSHFIWSSILEVEEIANIFKKYDVDEDSFISAYEENQKDRSAIDQLIDGVMDKFFGGMSTDGDPDEVMESIGFPLSSGVIKSGMDENTPTPLLDRYAKDLTKESHDPVFGRDSELSQLLEILSCRKKNNAILVGEPGVGKTSVVELLAQRISSKEVPPSFFDKKIYSLDLNSLVAGTKYRGQYEERLQGIIEEVIKNPNIIIFIDEIHNLIGNGGSDGNGDAANILKPYLAKGKFQCIGSTTFKEYRKFIEKDGALKRRFQNITISEPSQEETKNILNEVKRVYETHHNVKYPKEVIEACVSLSGRYITDRYFPDKALDILDLSGSLARLNESSKETGEFLRIEEELSNLRKKKIQSVLEENFDKGIEYRDKEHELSKKLSRASDTIRVTLDDVSLAVGKRSGVPIDSIGTSDLDKLRKLNATLPTQVIGQDKAIKEILLSLQKNSLSIRDPQKPIASLLFVGPTGSGKTYLCKTLAREFFGSGDALIKFDMSEYGEKHEITKLTGSTASYVGYDDEPGFEAVRKHPYSVVLFDEIEKAAPEIYQIFLSILDEGHITLGNGIKVDFKNTIIIFTGNIGTKELSLFGGGMGYGSTGDKKNGIDPAKKDSIINKSIERTFSPEFINRLSKTVIFNTLGRKELMKIADLEISQLATRLKASKITIKVTKSLKEYIISECDLKYGARDLQRGITRNIEEKICEYLLNSSSDGKMAFILDYTKEKGVTIQEKEKKQKTTEQKEELE